MSRLSEEKSKISNEPKIYNYYNKPEQAEEVKYVGAYFKRNQPTVQKKQEHSMFYQSEPRKPVNMQAEFQKLKVETDETSFYDDCEFEPKISSLSDEEHIDIVHDINLTEQEVIDTVENYILQSVEENNCNTYAETAKTVKNCLVEVGLIPQSASLNSIMSAEEVHYQNLNQVVDLLKEALKAAQQENNPPRTPDRKPKPRSPKAPKRPKRKKSMEKAKEKAKEAVKKSNSKGQKKRRVMAGNSVAKNNNEKAKENMKKRRKPLKRKNATSADVEEAEKAKKQQMRKEMQKKVHKKVEEARKKANEANKKANEANKKADEAKKKADEAKKKAEVLEKKAKEVEAAHASSHEAHAKKLFEMLGREGIEEAKLTLASELVDENGKSTMSDIQFASICLENGIGVDE